jgi:hypothetical protein
LVVAAADGASAVGVVDARRARAGGTIQTSDLSATARLSPAIVGWVERMEEAGSGAEAPGEKS